MERVRQRFDRQGFMRTIGATLESVESGTVTITCGFDERVTQQHGMLHSRQRILARMTATMMAVDAIAS